MGAVEDLEKVEKLRRLKFIGDFPKGIEVLLVSLDTATEELKLEYPYLTSSILKSILTRRNILIFSNLEQWVKYKNGTTSERKI
jgi:hypothetical protein